MSTWLIGIAVAAAVGLAAFLARFVHPALIYGARREVLHTVGASLVLRRHTSTAASPRWKSIMLDDFEYELGAGSRAELEARIGRIRELYFAVEAAGGGEAKSRAHEVRCIRELASIVESLCRLEPRLGRTTKAVEAHELLRMIAERNGAIEGATMDGQLPAYRVDAFQLVEMLIACALLLVATVDKEEASPR